METVYQALMQDQAGSMPKPVSKCIRYRRGHFARQSNTLCRHIVDRLHRPNYEPRGGYNLNLNDRTIHGQCSILQIPAWCARQYRRLIPQTSAWETDGLS
jgi:hypothetical protein